MFSAIIGVPVGRLAVIVASVGLRSRIDELSLGVRRATTAHVTFGLAVLGLLALRDVNIERSGLTFEGTVGASLAGVVVVYVALFVHDRNGS